MAAMSRKEAIYSVGTKHHCSEAIYSVGTKHHYLTGSEVKQSIKRSTTNGGYNE